MIARKLVPDLSNEKFLDYSKAFKLSCSKYGINTTKRLTAFLAQILHESGHLLHTSENLNYSADRLLVVFPKYFKTKEQALQYARNPTKIGSRVYANRLGNGDESTQEGYKFRGRGIMQLTGKSSYKEAGLKIYNNETLFILNPDLLLLPEYSVEVACWFWKSRGCNELADIDNFKGITLKINGGLNGYDDRVRLWNKAKTIFSEKSTDAS